jgi:NAD-dependent dihydropyrimidine dehydrogenase PreA subunit
MITIEVLTERCDGCRTCVDQCPTNVFEISQGKCVVINQADCMVCRLCETVCPQAGITVSE